MKELKYIEKSQTDQQECIRELSKISEDKLQSMPENQHLTFHQDFYLKQKVVFDVLLYQTKLEIDYRN